MIENAMQEAGATRGAIATEVARMRATAKREIEAARTAFDREQSEKKLIASKAQNKNLNAESAWSLLSEQARVDLELEVTARRAEAEADYLRKHQDAVAATQRYLDEANAMLAQARTRANAAKLESETLETAARAHTKRTTDEAREKAEAILLAAEAEARSILSEAQSHAAKELHKLKGKIAKLNVERDAVAQYLHNLREVVENAQQNLTRD
jgi:hypothetical protein